MIGDNKGMTYFHKHKIEDANINALITILPKDNPDTVIVYFNSSNHTSQLFLSLWIIKVRLQLKSAT